MTSRPELLFCSCYFCIVSPVQLTTNGFTFLSEATLPLRDCNFSSIRRSLELIAVKHFEKLLWLIQVCKTLINLSYVVRDFMYCMAILCISMEFMYVYGNSTISRKIRNGLGLKRFVVDQNNFDGPVSVRLYFLIVLCCKILFYFKWGNSTLSTNFQLFIYDQFLLLIVLHNSHLTKNNSFVQ